MVHLLLKCFLKLMAIVKMLQIFRKHFNITRHGKVPCRNTIQLRVENFRTCTSALKKKQPGSVSTMRSQQNIEAVRQSFIRSPRRSAKRYSVALGISDSSVSRILRKDLTFHPYKMVAVQGISDRDVANRSTVTERLIGILSDAAITLMTDEAHFCLSACFNRHNFQYWPQENPQQHQQRPRHSDCVTLCCGVANFRVICPYFFKDEDGRAVTITYARYVYILRNFLTPELSHRGTDLSIVWFQQDGTTARTARASMEVVREIFLEHVILLRGEIPWPARSPDLSASDYFLWGYLKAKVYIHYTMDHR
jgi:hypothetical protein